VIRLFDRRPCRAHQDALLDLAARRSTGPDVARALDHLERCRSCEDELAATTLVVHALRRLHDDTLGAEPAPDGWARLRARLATSRREPSRLLSGLPGIVAAAGLCAALVGPGAISGSRPVIYNEAPRSAPAPYLEFERSRERARAVGLLPEVEVPLPYRGIRIAPPPIVADLPPSMGRRAQWIEEVIGPAAGAAAALDDEAAQRRTGRR
jgi:hypothetical protein